MNLNVSIMKLEATKLELIQLLLQTQKMSVLERIKKVFEEAIIAYAVDGRPLTKSAYEKELLESEAEIARGVFTSLEDLEKASENW